MGPFSWVLQGVVGFEGPITVEQKRLNWFVVLMGHRGLGMQVEQFEGEFRKLTDVQLLRLKRFAQWRVRGLGRAAAGRDGTDLYGAALASIAAGQRVWEPDKVTLFWCLYWAIKSISSDWKEKRVADVWGESEISSSLERPVEEPPTFLDPERILAAKEQLSQIESAFENDLQALQILKFLAEGYTVNEIVSKLSMPVKAVQTAIKRVRRKVKRYLIRSAPAGNLRDISRPPEAGRKQPAIPVATSF